jgi:hypothetical protein
LTMSDEIANEGLDKFQALFRSLNEKEEAWKEIC